MKKILFILTIALSLVSCKKDNLSNCMVGNWHKTNQATLKITDNTFTFQSSTPLTYTLKDDVISLSNGSCRKMTCNDNTLTVEVVSCNGMPSAITVDAGSYTKD